MLDIEEIRRHLRYMVVSRVAEKTGLDRTAIIRLRDGISKRPAHAVVSGLSEFLVELRNG